MALCQRYYEFIGGPQQSIFADTNSSAGSVTVLCLNFNVNKRAVPTAAVLGTFTTSNSSGANLVPNKQGLTVWYNAVADGRAYWFNTTNSGFILISEL